MIRLIFTMFSPFSLQQMVRVTPEDTAPADKAAKFLNKAAREACYGARDEYWRCFKSSGEKKGSCPAERAKFEEACPATWVKHFDRNSVIRLGRCFGQKCPPVCI